MSESLANVTETTLCNVREGGATISDCLFSHLVHARMLSPTSTSLPALCHVVAMGKACCTMFCKQLLNVSKTHTGSVGTSAEGSSSQPLKLLFSSAFGRSSGVLQENLHVLLSLQLLMVIVDYLINFRQTAWAALWRCKWTGTPASGVGYASDQSCIKYFCFCEPKIGSKNFCQ